MDITGTIKQIGDTVQVTDKFKKREFVISTTDNYPQLIQFQITQDKVSLMDKYREGDEVTVHFNLRGREWMDKKGDIKYFNTLEAWRLESKTESPVPQSKVNESDLPF